MNGFVTFRLGCRELACPLDEVREVVRLDGVESLPGMAAGMAGLIELRGAPLPIVDLRADPASRGDVLVLADTDGGNLGVAVDRVVAIRTEHDLRPTEADTSGLPAYVTAVLTDGMTGATILLVALRALARDPLSLIQA
jgi:chemotaxis signal transduction protein